MALGCFAILTHFFRILRQASLCKVGYIVVGIGFKLLFRQKMKLTLDALPHSASSLTDILNFGPYGLIAGTQLNKKRNKR